MSGSLFHILFGRWFKRGADYVGPRVEASHPGVYRTYNRAGRIAAIALLVLVAVGLTVGLISWLVSQ